ncbi:hypothetical protein B0J17DRAFT_660599 [Rhizoctonia solani]|nr:hypothetical protein B0J17DRAFT_660599 [Rhizoctonia solani]
MEAKSPATLMTRDGHLVLNFSEVKSSDNPNSTSSYPASRAISRHPKFFFDNVLVAIQIEDTLFNVHKYQLAKSEVFSDMFKMPKPKGDRPEEGSSPEHPIIIEGVAASDFAALLTVLYAGQFSSNQPTPDAPLIVPAFRLANVLNFSELRAFLLPLAEENLDDVDKIVFAREFDINEWLVPAHVRLCKREEHLSFEEARKLQVDSVLMISQIREKHRTQTQTRSIAATTGTICCRRCVGWEPHGYTTESCHYCGSSGTGYYLRYFGPGAIGTNTTTNETALQSEVKKWVEDGYAAKD